VLNPFIQPRGIGLIVVQSVLLWSMPQTADDLPRSRLAVTAPQQINGHASEARVRHPFQQGER